MRIFIPTLNRGPFAQYTMRELPDRVIKLYRATLVAPAADAAALRQEGFHVLTCNAKGISATRQWILDHTEDPHVLMLDDDLSSWSWRSTDSDGQDVKYVKATEKERIAGFADVAKMLKRYSHGSIGHRLFANARDTLAFNTRQLRALAYNADVLKKERVKFRLPVMEDFDVQLQLLERGYDCFQYNQLVQEQRGSNEAGGCSTYRTQKVQHDAAMALAKLHPASVTVVQKLLRVGWGSGMGAERTDVRINWRKAVRAGKENAHAH